MFPMPPSPSKQAKSLPRSDDTQIERFKELARELGCDEDEALFDEALKRIARQKPVSGATKTADEDNSQ